MVLQYILQQFCMPQNNPLPAVGGAIMNYGHAVTIDHCHKVMNQKSHRVFFSIDNHLLSFDDFYDLQDIFITMSMIDKDR